MTSNGLSQLRQPQPRGLQLLCYLRPQPVQRHLPGRRDGLPPPRGDPPEGCRLPPGGRRKPERDLRQPAPGGVRPPVERRRDPDRKVQARLLHRGSPSSVTTRAFMSIGDVLKSLREEFPEVTVSKIRFLEAEGLIEPERTPSGYRKFYQQDLARLRYILRLQRDNFMPLKIIRRKLEQFEADGSDLAARTDGAAAGA